MAHHPLAARRSPLAKVIRDRNEEHILVSRVDQARVDKLLAEQDLLHITPDRVGG